LNYNKIFNSLHKLEKWISKNGDAGFDPYDVKGLNLKTMNLMKELEEMTFLQIIQRILLIEIADGYFPKITRKLLHIPPKIHPTSQGLLFSSYLNLYQLYPKKDYLRKAEKCKNWLIENRIMNYNNYCWGTPFSWKSGSTYYNIGTPFAVVCAWIGEAFYKNYQQFNDQESLQICKSICEFFINDLQISNVSKDKICFSYSPLKKDYVNNVNLFVAEFLIKIGTITNNLVYLDYGHKALNYTLSNQMPNGSIPYFGKEAKEKFKTDLYHSGYEIRMLYSIWKLTNNDEILQATKRYLQFFMNNYFHNGIIPKLTPEKGFLVDITACAEVILVFSELRKDFHIDEQFINNTVNWIICNMQTKMGWFIYRIKKNRYKVKIPYIRWGEAWMMLALSNLLKMEYNSENSDLG